MLGHDCIQGRIDKCLNIICVPVAPDTIDANRDFTQIESALMTDAFAVSRAFFVSGATSLQGLG